MAFTIPSLTSGETAIATVTNAEVVLLAAKAGNYTHLAIINDGAAAGFFRIGPSGTMSRLKANAVTVLDGIKWTNQDVMVKRIPAGANLSGLFAFAW